MRQIVGQGLVDIMLMSASTNDVLTIQQRLFDNTPVTPAVRANDTTDIHHRPRQPLSRASFPTVSHRDARSYPVRPLDCKPEERHAGANLGLYSITFNNDLERDRASARTITSSSARKPSARASATSWKFSIPTVPRCSRSPSQLPDFINDTIVRTLGGNCAGRPAAVSEDGLSRPQGDGRAGPLRSAPGRRHPRRLGRNDLRRVSSCCSEAKKYGARVALFGRKINNAENQLAFVHFLRLIVERQVNPAEAVRAYHAVLLRLGIHPNRKLEDDLQQTDQSMSYAGTARVSGIKRELSVSGPAPSCAGVPSANHGTTAAAACGCHSEVSKKKTTAENGLASDCRCKRPVITESSSASSRHSRPEQVPAPFLSNGRPDFSKMSPTERLAYHRERLGLGR